MHPLLMTAVPLVGGPLRSYQSLIVVAVLLGIWTGARVAERRGNIPRRTTWHASLVLAVIALAGARLHFVLVHPDRFASQPTAALPVWAGGLHAPGGIVAVACAAPLLLRWFDIPWRRFLDASAVAAGVSLAVTRVGCFLNGCCVGTLCAWPWGVRFPRTSHVFLLHADQGLVPPDATASAPVHPLQLYFAATAVLMAVVAWWVSGRKRYDGEASLAGLMVFSATSAMLEPFRADYTGRVYWGALPQLEWTTLAMTILSAGTFAVMAYRRRGRHPARSAAPELRRPVAV